MSSIFTSPAQCYAEYRPRYPRGLIDEMRERGVDERSEQLVDWGTGTGELAIPLSPFFDRVTAIDLHPEMIAAAQEHGRDAGIENVEWLHGRAENLRLEPGSCDLIVSGSAFHWMDREALSRKAMDALRTGGTLAVAAGAGGGRNIRERTEVWHTPALECLERHIGERQAGTRRRRQRHDRTGTHADFLDAAGFRIEQIDYPTEFSWRVEQVIGYMYSIGFASPHLLGDRREDFERDLGDALDHLDPSGCFHERIVFNVTIGYRP